MKKNKKRKVMETKSIIDNPFYMTSRSGNCPDYNPFGYKQYKQYDI